jgi:hypothetical protein
MSLKRKREEFQLLMIREREGDDGPFYMDFGTREPCFSIKRPFKKICENPFERQCFYKVVRRMKLDEPYFYTYK